jgi:uncharacterized phage protein (TIGR02220 family)
MFGKHFASMYAGSMFGKPALVFAVWGYVIATMRPSRKDKECYVELNPTLLAATFASTVEDVMEAIKVLLSPDPSSRSKADEGRRLSAVSEDFHTGPMQFRVVNGSKYRALRDEEERRVYLRDAKRKERESTMSTNVNQGQPPSSQAEAEAEVEVEAKTEEVPPATPPVIPSKDKELEAKATEILAYLSEKVSRSMRMTDSRLKIIVPRLREVNGDVDGVRVMIDRQCAMWKGTRMEEYLRPDTLFRASKFIEYYEAKDMPITSNLPDHLPPKRGLDAGERSLRDLERMRL